MTSQKFDGLAEDYDRSRPRYPAELWEALARRLPTRTDPLIVVDAGAGTGIALEGLVCHLPDDAQIHAVDVSTDMVRVGEAKLPEITWVVGEAEPFLEDQTSVDVVIAAQAFQWMDRPRFLAAALSSLRGGGVLAIVQNNRDFSNSAFLDAYETLLERRSPGYSRQYRSFDIEVELANVFGAEMVGLDTARWEQPMSIDEFVAMSSSSTQAQRAIAAKPKFLEEVRALADSYAGSGSVKVAYRSELFTASKLTQEAASDAHMPGQGTPR